ncbi:ABC transporter ATP-binding protein [Oscillibacter sp. MSJ-2]|uniref:ABC transporter ATP-binding protein n=1 Tax=Dysosmobacter acutus TaxID=2841504 RepID=A0ABS6F5B1_9FIRM|nr:ABC transporter ATP-binding protein [Dysosmobacter acutus]MBU5625484.1 ABC transporter ATP-binding protein [Dysosmobacter acutus]
MEEKLLEIKDLHVTYQTDEDLIYAANGINLTVNKGETLGIAGETGAGKSTMALSIMKLLPRVGSITGGSIEFEGMDLVKASEADMRLLRGESISMIFQDPMTALNPILTVGDQIDEVLKLHESGASEAQRAARVDEIMELVGIPAERKVEYPHQFSGGMKQRIVIAIALACEPKLLLADEPTTALDVTIQAQILEMMKALKEKLNTAMILITHDLGVVAEICDRVAIMYAGEIIESGSAEDIFEGGRHHPYTTGLFNSIPDLTKHTDRLSPIPGLMPDPANLPDGCKFHDRCPHCMEKCTTEVPAVIRQGTHEIACHLYAAERCECF